MVPAYCLLILSAVQLTRMSSKTTDPPRGKNRITAGIGISVFIIAWILPAYFFPVFTFQRPTGPFAVGTVSRCWIDESRQAEKKGRRLMLQIWYPAEPGTGSGIARYHPNVDYLASELAGALGLPRLMFGNLLQVKTNSLLQARLAGARQQYPLLLFSHGLNGYRFQNTFQTEELASHGYIVIAIDHSDLSSGTVFPDGRTSPVRRFDSFSEERLKAFVLEWVSDARFVLDRLTAINKADPDAMFTNRLDLTRIGYFGHSLGGTTAAETLSLDGRIKAGLDMDGYPLGNAYKRLAKQPFMHLESDRSLSDISDEELNALHMTRQLLQHLKEVWDQRTAKLCRNGFFLKIRGSKHFDFSDCPLWTPLASLMGLTGNLAPRRVHRIINDFTLAFFDTFLKGKESPLLDRSSIDYPEVEVADNADENKPAAITIQLHNLK
jgi:predicted dienelactone hydrolase